MQFEFFPSRTLALYLARLFITRILGVAVMLVLVLQLLDLLGESGHILANPGNGEAAVWHYVTLRTPQIVQFVLPYSVLLATLVTFFPLNQNSEIIAMRAAGLSAHQVLSPLLATALLVAGVSFAFNERVVTRATATLSAWKEANYRPVAADSEVRGNVFVADGSNILFAQTASGEGNAVRLHDVTWYVRDNQGALVEQIRGTSATYAAPGWRLIGARAFTLADTRTRDLAPLVVGLGVTPQAVEISRVDADGQSLLALARSIRALRASGRRTAELEGKWWHKLSKPLSAVLMPLLGAVAAFGLARSGQLLIRTGVGFALGFAYFVVDNACLAMGNFGSYPPLIAAWAPFALFALIGETVLIKTEE